jgi:hypothetical protein
MCCIVQLMSSQVPALLGQKLGARDGFQAEVHCDEAVCYERPTFIGRTVG